jgi:hypothetical protein
MTQSDALPDLGQVGIWTAGFDLLSPAELNDTVAELDELGFGTAWFGEAYGREAFTQARLLLAASKQMVIATGIANIWARDAPRPTRVLAALAPGMLATARDHADGAIRI